MSCERHPQKLLPRIAVMLDGGLVDFEEGERFLVKHQHRVGLPSKMRRYCRSLSRNRCFRLLAVTDIAQVNHHPGNFRIAQPALADRLQMTPGAVPVPETEFQCDRAVGILQAVVEPLAKRRGGPRDG